MPKYARLNASNDIELVRELPSLPDPNPAKGWRWLPVDPEEAPPPFDARMQTASRQHVVDGGKVKDVWTVSPLARSELLTTIKTEASKRILARYPAWKQANMTARGVELVSTRIVNGDWTKSDAEDAEALRAAWDWVKAVRAASDALEALDPTPLDFTANRYWPE